MATAAEMRFVPDVPDRGGRPTTPTSRYSDGDLCLGNSIDDGRKTTGRKGERGKGRGRRRRRRLWEEEVKKEF